MQLVIDISEDAYKRIIEDGEVDYLKMITAIENGAPLPKGHGRLIDMDVLIEKSHIHTEFDEDGFGESFDFVYVEDIYNAPILVEADKSRKIIRRKYEKGIYKSTNEW